jgi:hypothetical protein
MLSIMWAKRGKTNQESNRGPVLANLWPTLGCAATRASRKARPGMFSKLDFGAACHSWGKLRTAGRHEVDRVALGFRIGFRMKQLLSTFCVAGDRRLPLRRDQPVGEVAGGTLQSLGMDLRIEQDDIVKVQ